MPGPSTSSSRIVLSADGNSEASLAAKFQASSALTPLMIGISAPALLVLLVDPHAVQRQPFLV